MKNTILGIITTLLLISVSESTAQTVSGAAIKDAVASYIKQSLPRFVETMIDFQDVKTSYPVGYKRYHLVVNSVNSVTLKGVVTFLVKATAVGKEKGFSQVIPVVADIRTFQNVLVSSQTIQPHAVISADEVTSVKTETTGLPNPVTNLAELNGKWSSRWIQSGRALTFDMFEDEPVVKRGDAVTIIYKTKNVVVQEQGSAVQDGRLNDIITVVNEYRDNLRGRVIGKGEVVLVN